MGTCKLIQYQAVLLATGLVWAAGCDRFTAINGSDLEHNPDYRRARNAEAAGDFHVAATFYNKTLRALPNAGQAHLELGVLCDEKLGDPIAAIYHYRQFLELEPNSERRQVVESYVERAKLSLAAKLPAATGADPGELVRLQSENSTLRQENAALRADVAEFEHATNVVANTGTIPVVTPPVVTTNLPLPAGVRTHTVQKGDTLFSIAVKYYGTRSAWEKVYAANRANLPNKDQLKIGQQLVVP